MSVFVNSEDGQLNQSRVFVGLKGRVDRWSPKVYIMDKASKRNNDWDHTVVLGVSAFTAF